MSTIINGQKIIEGAFEAGLVANPSIRFVNALNDGFYRIGANNWGLSLNGVKNIDFAPTLTTFAAPSVYSTGVAVTAGSYWMGRNADATNLMQLEVPTGASYEFSVNDSTVVTISTVGAISANSTVKGSAFLDTGGTFNAGTGTLFGITNAARVYGAAGTPLVLGGQVADGATTVGTYSGSNVALATAGAKLHSFMNATVEKAYIDKDGGIVLGGSMTPGAMIFGKQGTDIASANDATLTLTGNYFDVTGATQINTLIATGVQAGTQIILQFDSNPLIKHATAGAGAQFYLSGAADYQTAAGGTLTVTYDGTYWREISRS